MIRMFCTGGVIFTGQSPDTIARREFGTNAFYRPRRDPNAIECGQILTPSKQGGHTYWICAVVLRIEEMS